MRVYAYRKFCHQRVLWALIRELVCYLKSYLDVTMATALFLQESGHSQIDSSFSYARYSSFQHEIVLPSIVLMHGYLINFFTTNALCYNVFHNLLHWAPEINMP